MRLVFAGTPEVAVPSLEALVASRHEVVAVLTRPDARAGRGRGLVPSPVRVRAEALGIEVLTPRRPGDPDFRARLTELAPDACPVVAYGGLIPPELLDVPASGWVNLHFSLLPAWRGAAPVQHAVMAGDEVTGATTFRLEEGLDTGPTYGVMTETIRGTDTAGDLLQRLSTAGRRPAGRHPGRPGGRDDRGGAPAGRRRLARAQAHRRGRQGPVGPARARGRPAGPRVHPRTRCLDHLPR